MSGRASEVTVRENSSGGDQNIANKTHRDDTTISPRTEVNPTIITKIVNAAVNPKQNKKSAIALYTVLFLILAGVIVGPVVSHFKNDNKSSGQASIATTETISPISGSMSSDTASRASSYTPTATGSTPVLSGTPTSPDPAPDLINTPKSSAEVQVVHSTPLPSSRFTTSIRSPPITSAAVLPPGASCSANTQCGPNDCYPLPGTAATCCGPSIWGCPGWSCVTSGNNDCLDPYTCASVGIQTCG